MVTRTIGLSLGLLLEDGKDTKRLNHCVRPPPPEISKVYKIPIHLRLSTFSVRHWEPSLRPLSLSNLFHLACNHRCRVCPSHVLELLLRARQDPPANHPCYISCRLTGVVLLLTDLRVLCGSRPSLRWCSMTLSYLSRGDERKLADEYNPLTPAPWTNTTSTGFLVPRRVQVFPKASPADIKAVVTVGRGIHDIGSFLRPVSSSSARGRQTSLSLSPHWPVITSPHSIQVKGPLCHRWSSTFPIGVGFVVFEVLKG